MVGSLSLLCTRFSSLFFLLHIFKFVVGHCTSSAHRSQKSSVSPTCACTKLLLFTPCFRGCSVLSWNWLFDAEVSLQEPHWQAQHPSLLHNALPGSGLVRGTRCYQGPSRYQCGRCDYFPPKVTPLSAHSQSFFRIHKGWSLSPHGSGVPRRMCERPYGSDRWPGLPEPLLRELQCFTPSVFLL